MDQDPPFVVPSLQFRDLCAQAPAETEGALTFEPVAGGTRMCWSWTCAPADAA